MSTLNLSPLQAPQALESTSVAPSSSKTGTTTSEPKRETLPAHQGAEQLPRKRISARPGAVTPRQSLNTLPSARARTQAPGAAMPHPDAVHHTEAQDPPQARSHALSTFTINSSLDVDLKDRKDPLALPDLARLTSDLRKPDARAATEAEATKQLRRPSGADGGT